jgi:drug/metabolite transporter (DMT)-like permease
MSMGDALTIASSTPIFVAILARVFLGEKCGVITVVASLFTFIGVVAMTRPPMLTGAESFDTQTLVSESWI